jgi:hypothetical protein
MKLRTLALAFAFAFAAGCGDDSTGDPIDGAPPPPDAPPPPMIDAPPGTPDARPDPTNMDVTADIMGDTTWTADHFYTLKTHIFVRSGTLTIEPGVEIFGDSGSSLVVTTGGRVDAQGTANAPIRFTSSQPEGSRVGGDWGGVVLLGLAPINVMGGTNQIEGFPAGTTGTQYGGSDATHDCGTLNYVEIHFGGFMLAPNNELNGLTLGGCGTGTDIDFVHVHQGSDDGIEVFGGTVDIKHAISSQNQDDGFDWDFGWQGRVQYFIVQHSALSNQGIEADNHPSAFDSMPRTQPTVYNMSIFGSGVMMPAQTQKGMHLRRGVAGHMYNVIVAYASSFPVDIDGADSVEEANGGNLFVRNSIFFANGSQTLWDDSTDNDGGFIEGVFFRNPTEMNRESDPLTSSATNQENPNFQPGAGSPAFTGGATPPNDGFFDTSATFVGAVGASDWTAGGWATYPQN